jgi:hypothetical protein
MLVLNALQTLVLVICPAGASLGCISAERGDSSHLKAIDQRIKPIDDDEIT